MNLSESRGGCGGAAGGAPWQIEGTDILFTGFCLLDKNVRHPRVIQRSCANARSAPSQLTMSDDDGFVGYQETTVDPGPWLNVATALFCVVSILVFPFLVAAGRSYEKQKLAAQGSHDLTLEEEAENDHGNSVQEETVNDENLNTPERPCQNDACSSSPSSYVHGKSVASGYSPPPTKRSALSGVENAGRAWLDKMIIPPYPDDDVINRSTHSLWASPARRSNASSLSESRHAKSTNNGRGTSSTIVDILDSGAAARRRRGVVRQYKRNQKEKQWEEEQLMANRLELGNDATRTMFRSLVRDSQHEREKEEETCLFDEEEQHRADDASVRWMRLKNVPPGTPLTPEGLRRASVTSSCQASDADEKSVVESSVMESVKGSDILPDDAVDGEEPGRGETVPMEGENLNLRPSTLAAAFDRLLEVANFDREMKRILSLAVPFSMSAVTKGLLETVRVALVANYIGTDAVSAYTIVLLVLGLTHEFMGGFTYTCASLCSHAVGAENDLLAGQYVQISSILYSLCMVPNAIVWFFFTSDVVRLFGFNETTAEMAQVFARYYVVKEWFQGVDEAYGALLCIIEHERFVALMAILNEIVATSIILWLVLTRPTTLADVGLAELCSQALFFSISLVLTIALGWMKKFTRGIFRTFALLNVSAVKTVCKTAVPLAFGQLLTYGEWEVLTIFVAYLGPAEVTSWGIVGSLWDTLEMLTDGFGDAGEVRTGLHLGAARPARARLSSYKTMLVGVISSTICTAVLWILGEDLATWLTPDPTLQGLIIDVLPLMGMGNIALSAGSISWALVGAQGRYRLATFVAFVSSWCITLPLAAVFVYGFNFNLQGPVSAVVIGYSVTGTSLLYVLCRSDWTRLSKLLVEENGGIESDDESEYSEKIAGESELDEASEIS
jgi:MATE family multidrug resistance protein